jgi:neutral ceramidase
VFMIDQPSHTGLQAGIARAIITPPVGTPLVGTLREKASQAVEQELTATALVLAHAETKVCLIACDLLLFTPTDARCIRDRVGEALGIPAEHVLLNTSHTHAAPAPANWYEYNQMEDDLDTPVGRLLQIYHAGVAEQVVGAARAADLLLQPARAGAGSGSLQIGINRREWLPDGTMVLGENSDGIVDPAVDVLRLDTLSGEPIALLLHYSCHPDVLGPKCDLISPDYVGATRATTEAITGATTIFLQGTSGDIDPLCGIVVGVDGVDEMRRLGTMLGCEASRIFQEIRTARRRDHRVAWQSAASTVTGWVYAEPTSRPPTTLTVANRILTLPLHPLPDVSTADATVREYETELAAVVSGPHSMADRLRSRRRLRWAQIQRDAVLAGEPARLDFELQAVRLDDLVIVAMPGEIFVEIGLAIKAASPAPHTLICGYSNGLYFYVPTAAACAEGGYEVESYRNFLWPSGPTPAWEELLVGASTELIDTLWGERESVHRTGNA